MFKDNLRYLRKVNGMNQLNLADKLSISDKTISSWEQGRTEPNMKQLKELAKIFNVDMNELIGAQIGDSNIYGDHEANLKHFEDDPELLALYKDIYESESLQLLFDSARDLTPEDLETVLIHIRGIRKARGLD